MLLHAQFHVAMLLCAEFHVTLLFHAHFYVTMLLLSFAQFHLLRSVLHFH